MTTGEKVNIGFGDITNAKFRNITRRDHIVSQGGRNFELIHHIIAIDIRTGVGFGIAHVFSCQQNRVKIEMRPLHLIQNIITRTIKDAFDGIDLVNTSSTFQIANPGNATTSSGFKIKANVMLSRRCDEFRQVLRNDSFIGGHHMFTVLQCT